LAHRADGRRTGHAVLLGKARCLTGVSLGWHGVEAAAGLVFV
jgi:hypothetical protein